MKKEEEEGKEKMKKEEEMTCVIFGDSASWLRSKPHKAESLKLAHSY